jgi:hypothetical protein
MRRTRAYTLVELSVAMTAGSTVMILAIGLLHQSMTLGSIARARADSHRTLNRLAHEFRGHVHQAKRCIAEPEQDIRIVMPDDSQVVYQVDGNRIDRRQQLNDGPIRRESFLLDEGTTATFEISQQPTRAILTVIRQPSRAIDVVRVDRKVAAVVGRRTAHENGEVSP